MTRPGPPAAQQGIRAPSGELLAAELEELEAPREEGRCGLADHHAVGAAALDQGVELDQRRLLALQVELGRAGAAAHEHLARVHGHLDGRTGSGLLSGARDGVDHRHRGVGRPARCVFGRIQTERGGDAGGPASLDRSAEAPHLVDEQLQRAIGFEQRLGRRGGEQRRPEHRDASSLPLERRRRGRRRGHWRRKGALGDDRRCLDPTRRSPLGPRRRWSWRFPGPEAVLLDARAQGVARDSE